MNNLLQLHQGPGLNNLHLFYTANSIPRSYCPQSDTTTFVLNSDYSLHIRGNHTESCDKIFSPDICKLLDILVCGLESASPDHSRQTAVSLDDFIQLTGYKLTKANRDSLRPQMKEGTALLEKISLSWTEEGKYRYKDVKIFDRIAYQNAVVSAVFTEQAAQYLLHRPVIELPHSLMSINKKYYSLGRRCLIHQAVNQERTCQRIRVKNLLAVCPHIPQPEPDGTWQPSILERKVISPFTTAMNSLADLQILQWNFQNPTKYENYDQFADSIMEFQILSSTQNNEPVQDIPPVHKANTPIVFPINEFLARCRALHI